MQLFEPSMLVLSGTRQLWVWLKHLQVCQVTNHGASGSQEKALQHAFKLPNLKRLVYSTCSSHSIEGEEVIQKVMPLATQLGFHLEVRFFLSPLEPHWCSLFRAKTMFLLKNGCVNKTIQEKD